MPARHLGINPCRSGSRHQPYGCLLRQLESGSIRFGESSSCGSSRRWRPGIPRWLKIGALRGLSAINGSARPKVPRLSTARSWRPVVRLHLHLVSDSTGETVITVARAGVSQFDGVIPVEHVWSFVRNRAQVDQVLTMVKALPGVVIFTLVSPDLRQALQEGCHKLNTPCVPILDGVFAALSSLLGAETPAADRSAACHGCRLFLAHRSDELHAAPRRWAGGPGSRPGRPGAGRRVAHLQDAALDLSRQPRHQGRQRARGAGLPPAARARAADPSSGGRPDDQPRAAGADPDEQAAAAARRAAARTRPRFDGDYAELEQVREELVYARAPVRPPRLAGDRRHATLGRGERRGPAAAAPGTRRGCARAPLPNSARRHDRKLFELRNAPPSRPPPGITGACSRFLLGLAAVAIVGGYGYQVGVSANQAWTDKLEADLQRFQQDNLACATSWRRRRCSASNAETALEELQRRYRAEVPDGAARRAARAGRGAAACRRRRRAAGLPDRCRGPGCRLRRGTGHQALPAAHADHAPVRSARSGSTIGSR